MYDPKHLEALEHAGPLEQLETFIISEAARLQAARDFLTEALPIIGNITACNEVFESAARPDLFLTVPAKMMDVTDPLVVTEVCNNFMPNFEINTGTRKIEKTDSLGSAHTEYEVIPITESELEALIHDTQIPHNKRFLDPKYNSHASKPAFVRMFMLFPDFTKRLVLDFSQQGYGKLFMRYQPELFAAYQVMARLVDENDEYVVRDGEVDDWYLCR